VTPGVLPVTEDEYLALDSRSAGAELWDGNLLVRPRETPRHALVAGALATALRVGLTDLHVFGGVAVRLAPGRIVVPDLIIAGEIDLDQRVVEAAAVRVVCEIVSPASATIDRVLKMHNYAAARIPCYLIAEPGLGALHSHELSGDAYVAGSVMRLVQVTGVEFGPP